MCIPLLREGVEWRDAAIPYLLATPEKALLDTLYISTRKKRRFARLPEVELDAESFSDRTCKKLLRTAQLPPQISVAMQLRYDALRGAARPRNDVARSRMP